MPPLNDMGRYEPIVDGINATRRALNDGVVNLRRLPVPVATRAKPSIQTTQSLSTGTLRGGTARVRHQAARTARGLRLIYSNHYPETGALETPGPNPITVKASLEFSGQIIPVAFAGADSVVIAPGANVVSDPVGIEILKGALFFTRTYVSTASAGQKFPRGGVAVVASDGGHNYADPAGADLTGVGVAWPGSGTTINEYVLGPSAILGSVLDNEKAVVGVVADSVGAGSGDSPGEGWINRLLGADYSLINVAYPSESASIWLGTNGFRRFRRMGLVEECGITHIIAGHIRNDVASALNQYMAMAQSLTNYWKTVSKYGKTLAVTCTPQTASTDNWATIENQSPFYPGTERESNRVGYNIWMRDGAPMTADLTVVTAGSPGIRAGDVGHPLVGIIDVANAVETFQGSGKWKPGFTSDGTHPNSTGAAAIAASLQPTTFFGPVSVV